MNFFTKEKNASRGLSEGIYLELRGMKRMVAEGIDALLEYTDSRITVGSGMHRLAISGRELGMCFLSENRIVIEGEIVRIEYEEQA